MKIKDIVADLSEFSRLIDGDFYTDEVSRILYSTDASLYRENPLAVLRPKNKEDIKKAILFALKHQTSLIPRGAGTSLAGQVVGAGIVADVSRYMNQILELNQEEKWVRVQPGVVLDELNMFLKPFGLFFGPETSTSNRCTIGGMLGNNSCGSHSLVYGSTREHVLEVVATLSDGSEAVFNALDNEEFAGKCLQDNLEGRIYQNIRSILSQPEHQQRIVSEFPDPQNKRRNCGYAIDILLDSSPFLNSSRKFNFCKLLAGSEGTLAFASEIKLGLVPLPPKEVGLLCVNFASLEEALEANLVALKYSPTAVELMDNYILECTKENIEQQRNRFFVNGDPKAVLIIEFAKETQTEIKHLADELTAEMRSHGFGYHFPLVMGEDTKRVWNLRKAGLGLLSNLPGDKRNVTVIEDTAVHPRFLPQYIAEFKEIMKKYGQDCIYHAHIGSGELHLRPMLDLKKQEDILVFERLAEEVALLVKKYKGSLSGEHGDGRLRAQFIPLMIGEENYDLLKQIKNCWDPNGVFNPGKIVDAPKITSDFRYVVGTPPVFPTFSDFSKTEGLLRAVENCNGSGDCRKSAVIGGAMCPSFMATRNELDSTRGRANMLREMLTQKSMGAFESTEIYQCLDLCLGCKACKSECPSNVDMAKLKFEFLQHYYNRKGVPFRTWVIANISHINRLASIFPKVANFVLNNKHTSSCLKKAIDFAPERSFPLLSVQSIRAWLTNADLQLDSKSKKGELYLFVDEFTQYNDAHIGIVAIQLLTRLGYEVHLSHHEVSGRTYISKGLLKQAKQIAEKNVRHFSALIRGNCPLVGLEPSAILSFRDEYPDLLKGELKTMAQNLAENCLSFDEFVCREIENSRIKSDSFHSEPQKIYLHGHCQQKAIASSSTIIRMLSLPINYKVNEIKSTCCGMAGSFGYEKEHFELSMQIGELSLFPAIRRSEPEAIIVAAGTSCRHQIKDGTSRTALHPVEVLFDALIK